MFLKIFSILQKISIFSKQYFIKAENMIKYRTTQKRMKSKYKLIITGTSFAAVLTTMSYIMERYATLWLTLEAMILPAVYIIGYEMLMERQKRRFEKDMLKVKSTIMTLKKEADVERENIKYQ